MSANRFHDRCARRNAYLANLIAYVTSNVCMAHLMRTCATDDVRENHAKTGSGSRVGTRSRERARVVPITNVTLCTCIMIIEMPKGVPQFKSVRSSEILAVHHTISAEFHFDQSLTPTKRSSAKPQRHFVHTSNVYKTAKRRLLQLRRSVSGDFGATPLQ